MPDFLTHVLAMYIVLRLAALKISWLDRPYIVAGMAGALIPDAVKITLLVPGYLVEAWLGVPFSWAPLHRLGGALLTAAIASLLVEAAHRRRVFGLFVVGLCSHLVLDTFLTRPGPYTYDMLYPLTYWRVPWLDFNLYLSSDVWPAAVAIVAAAVVALGSRWVEIRA